MYQGKSYQEELKVIDGCVRCTLSNLRTHIVKYRGNPRTDIFFIGEGPGYNEDKQGKPFVGKTGSYLVNLLADNKLDISQYMMGNCVMCRVPDNADPQAPQIEACSEWLSLQIKLVKPRLIVSVGRIASARLVPEWTDKHRITKEEGSIYRSSYFGANILAIRHPSSILRNPSMKTGYEDMLAKVVPRILSGELMDPTVAAKSQVFSTANLNTEDLF